MKEISREYDSEENEWYKKYDLEGEVDIEDFVRNVLDSELDFSLISVIEDVEGDMQNYAGDYSKSQLLQILSYVRSDSTLSNENSIYISGMLNQDEVRIIARLSSYDVCLVTNNEELSLEDILKKSKTL